MKLGIQFKNYRKRLKIKQSDLIKKSGVTRSTVWRFERGMETNISTVEKLIEVMDAKIILVHKDI
jgi:transcriptional regulator with XRE-family HTH domain